MSNFIKVATIQNSGSFVVINTEHIVDVVPKCHSDHFIITLVTDDSYIIDGGTFNKLSEVLDVTTL